MAIGFVRTLRARLRHSLPLVGTLYLVYLTLQPAPARYVGGLCLLVLAPFLVGWLVGNVANRGPWASSSVE